MKVKKRAILPVVVAERRIKLGRCRIDFGNTTDRMIFTVSLIQEEKEVNLNPNIRIS